MNDNDTLIRQLLDSYYDATLDSEGLQRLLRLLQQAEGLAPDLQADRDMLLALHGMKYDGTSRAASRARTAATIAAAAKRRSRLLPRILFASSCAAAAIIALIAAYNTRTPGRTVPVLSPATPSLTASSGITHKAPARTERQPASAPAEAATEEPAAHHGRKSADTGKATASRKPKKQRQRVYRYETAGVDAETAKLVTDLITTVETDFSQAVSALHTLEPQHAAASGGDDSGYLLNVI